jgi:hypothetical protein
MTNEILSFIKTFSVQSRICLHQVLFLFHALHGVMTVSKSGWDKSKKTQNFLISFYSDC